MKQIWNIMWKDLVRFRALFAAWTLLIVVKYLFYAAISGIWAPANFRQLHIQGALGSFLTFGIEALVGYFLAASLVYEDPVADKDPFWITRPIAGWELLGAKLLTAGLVLVVWPVLLSLPWWLECGYRLPGLVPIVSGLVAFYAVVMLAGFACASATNSYPRLLLWTFAGLAAFALVFALPVVGGRVSPFSTPEATFVHLSVALLTLMAVSLEVVWHQFVVRYFRWTIVAVISATLLAGMAVFSSPLAGLTARITQRDEVKWPADTDLRLAPAGPVRVGRFGTNPAGVLEMPVRLEGFVERTMVLGFQVSGTWKAADDKVWTTPGGTRSRQLDLRAARNIVGLPALDRAPPVETIQFIFRPRGGDKTPYAQRIAEEADSFRGRAILNLSERRLLAELPVREQRKHFEGGSLTIGALERRSGEVRFNFTVRVPAGPTATGIWMSGLYLLNRRTGELVEMDRRAQLGRGVAQLNFVVIAMINASFKVPATPGWLDDATLVVMGNTPDRKVTIDFAVPHLKSLTTKAPLPAERRAVVLSPEILRRYVGAYAPRENLTVRVVLDGDHLVVRAPDVPEQVLTPESETRFFLPGSDVVLEFVRGDNGATTHVVVHLNGQDIVVPRTSDSAAVPR